MYNNRNRIKITSDHAAAFDILLLSKEKFNMRNIKDEKVFYVSDKQIEELQKGGIDYEYI